MLKKISNLCDRIRQVKKFLNHKLSYKTKSRQGFFIKKPTKHSLYNETNCLVDWICANEHLARESLRMVAKIHQSLSTFKESQDKFGDKEFAIYYHRLYKQCFVIRNPDYKNPCKLDRAYYIMRDEYEKLASKENKDINLPPYYPPKGKKLVILNFKMKDKSLEGDIAAKMFSIWKENLPDLPPPVPHPLTQAAAVSLWEDFCEERFEIFEKFCQFIAKSPFLTGQSGDFQLSFAGLTNADFRKKICDGHYHAFATFVPPASQLETIKEEQRRDRLIRAFLKDHPQREELEKLRDELSPTTFFAWIVEPHIAFEREEEELKLGSSNLFCCNEVINRFEDTIKGIFNVKRLSAYRL